MSKKKRRRHGRQSRPARPSRPAPAGAGSAVTRVSRHPPQSAVVTHPRTPPVIAPEGAVGLVAAGELDLQLPALQAAISRRWADLRRDAEHQAAARVRVGDRVRIVHGMRPQYLQGATGTVTGWSGRSAVVQLDMPVGRYRTGEVCCPPLGLVPAAAEDR